MVLPVGSFPLFAVLVAPLTMIMPPRRWDFIAIVALVVLHVSQVGWIDVYCVKLVKSIGFGDICVF